MDKQTVIKVEDLSKQYRLGLVGTGTLSDDIQRWWYKIKGKDDPFLQIGEANDRSKKGSSDYVWSLKDINFEVKKGEAIGIIGKNGAGKSTLLKILSQVTSPTKGEVKIKGRIASLLEVGTGFHRDLSGRENIFLNGAILGMSKSEIKSKFDEIVAFSGVERYIDTPVKRYSSGMYVRLAFAVAAHLEPEILIVDEVLAVGDAEFQRKCLGKMKDVSEEGRTVLFVSHNMQAISTLTNKCIFLSKGMISFQGDTPTAISKYLSEDLTDDLIYTAKAKENAPTITRVEIKTSDSANTQVNGSPMEIHFEIDSPIPVDKAALSFQILDSFQVPVVHLWQFDSEIPFLRKPGKYKLICSIPKVRLYFGKYSLKIHFAQFGSSEKFETLFGVCPFEVVMFGKDREYQWQSKTCVYMEDAKWEVINN